MKDLIKHPNVNELKTQIDRSFNKALSDRDEKVERYQNSFKYYLGQAPIKDIREESAYVEPIVRKAVDAVKPSLLNIFTENEKKAVSFRPNAIVPPGVAGKIDEFINDLFLRDNDGHGIAERAISEALITGDTFIRYFVEENMVEEEVTLDGVNSEVLLQILNEFPDTDQEQISNLSEDDNGLVSGHLELKRIEKNVVVEHVPFNDIFVSGDTENIADAKYVGYRTKRTVGELIEMGYKREKVEVSGRVNEDDTYLSLKELINQGTFTDDGDDSDVYLDPMMREVYLYEHYIYSSLFSKKGKVELFKVCSTEWEILDIEPISRIPFVHGVPDRIPGSFWGISFYDKFKATQDILSRMFRTQERQAMNVAFGRIIAVKNQYTKESLLNNRPGGVVEVATLGAIQPFPYAEANTQFEPMMNRLNASARDDMASSAGVDVTGASGISATAAAITANAADLKDKVIARVLSYTLFKPLFEGLYEIIQNEDIKIGEVVDQMGMVKPIRGGSLPKHSNFVIDVNTGKDDDILATNLITLGNTFAQWSQIQNAVMTPASYLAIAKQVLGLSEEEVKLYFHVKEPTPEEQAAAAQQQLDQFEMTGLNKELLKAQVGLAAADVAKKQQEVVEMIEDGKAKREELRAKIAIDFKKTELKERELEAEVSSGQKITVGRYD